MSSAPPSARPEKRGNPIEIAAVVVWRVEETAKAVFDVDDFERHVAMQSESALRHVTSLYAYDHGEDDASDETTLRRNVVEVSAALKAELEERLAKAGVVVDEERKAAMISNLMVVLCGESEVHPVVNTGTLYQ